MREFDYSKLKDRTWNNEILIKVANIHEAKGRQETLWAYYDGAVWHKEPRRSRLQDI